MRYRDLRVIILAGRH